MNWKFELKTNLWADCVSQGHVPVVVAVSGASVSVHCLECRKVWRVATLGKLQSITEEDLMLEDDTVMKKKVLMRMVAREA